MTDDFDDDLAAESTKPEADKAQKAKNEEIANVAKAKGKATKVIKKVVKKITKKTKILKSDVAHNGAMYEKGCECPKDVLELFEQKGFIEEAQMTYATTADIENELKNISFSISSDVKISAISGFLNQADAVIDMYIG